MTLNELIRDCYTDLLRFSKSIVKNETNARDLITECYLDLIERKKEYPKKPKDFKKWMFRYIQLHSMAAYGNYNKQFKKREIPTESFEEIPNNEDRKSNEILHELKEFKSSLDELDKILFELIYEEKLSYRDIQRQYAELGFVISVGSICQLHRPLKQKIILLKTNTLKNI